MADNSCNSIIDSLLKGMDSVMTTKTVVGEATNIGDTIILPLVDVSFGVGAGASNSGSTRNGGGGGGLTGKISPTAVLVIKNGQTKLVNIKNQETTTKILDMIPDIFDKITDLVDKKNMPTNQEAIDAAFSEADNDDK